MKRARSSHYQAQAKQLFCPVLPFCKGGKEHRLALEYSSHGELRLLQGLKLNLRTSDLRTLKYH